MINEKFSNEEIKVAKTAATQRLIKYPIDSFTLYLPIIIEGLEELLAWREKSADR